MDSVIELDPNNFRSYVLRGLGHFQTGQLELGFSDLDTAIELADENPALYVIRALYHSNTDNFDDALLDLELADEIYPDYLLTRAYRGTISLIMSIGPVRLIASMRSQNSFPIMAILASS